MEDKFKNLHFTYSILRSKDEIIMQNNIQNQKQ